MKYYIIAASIVLIIITFLIFFCAYRLRKIEKKARPEIIGTVFITPFTMPESGNEKVDMYLSIDREYFDSLKSRQYATFNIFYNKENKND